MPYLIMLILYTILSILLFEVAFTNLYYSSTEFLEAVYVLVFIPPIVLGVYGVKYFKPNYGRTKSIYKKMFPDEKEGKEFWGGYYSEEISYSKKLDEILIGFNAGAITALPIVFLLVLLFIMLMAEYLFFIVGMGWIVFNYLRKKKIEELDLEKKFLGISNDLFSMKGLTGWVAIVMGYVNCIMLLVISMFYLILLFRLGGKEKGILILYPVLILPVITIDVYFFLYMNKIQRRFKNFHKIFYGKKPDESHSLPYGKDLLAFVAPLILFPIIYSIYFTARSVGNTVVLFFSAAVISAIFITALYIYAIVKTIELRKIKIYDPKNLRKDNFRILGVGMIPLIILFEIISFSKIYEDTIVSSLLIAGYEYLLLSFVFYSTDIKNKLQKRNLTILEEDFLILSPYIVLFSIPIFIFSSKVIQRLFYPVLILAISLLILVLMTDWLHDKMNS